MAAQESTNRCSPIMKDTVSRWTSALITKAALAHSRLSQSRYEIDVLGTTVAMTIAGELVGVADVVSRCNQPVKDEWGKLVASAQYQSSTLATSFRFAAGCVSFPHACGRSRVLRRSYRPPPQTYPEPGK